MTDQNRPIDKLLTALQERAKELNCLYRVEEILNNVEGTLADVFDAVIRAIPPGWQYPEACQARIIYRDQVFTSPGFEESPWQITTEVLVQDDVVGSITVIYTREFPAEDQGPFLKEEAKLIHTIADRLGHYLQFKLLREMIRDWQTAQTDLSEDRGGQWRVVLELLRRTDQNLFLRITRKMMIHLCWHGIREAEDIQRQLWSDEAAAGTGVGQYENQPSRKGNLEGFARLADEILEIAANHLTDDEILSRVQKWIQEDKASFLVKACASVYSSLSEIADALRRFMHLASEGVELPPFTETGVRVSLIRRFLTDSLEFINIAKDYVKLNDFHELLQRMVFPTGSHGKLGGKSSGLFLASRIICSMISEEEDLRGIKVPKTWYIPSDGLLAFMNFNNLEEIVEQKYKEIDDVRREYGHIVQLFKNSRIPPDIMQGLSVALDDFEDRPLIVRSSSLLEDRLGAAFSGKYKSLFLANQGTKKQRLEALMDAIAEVYSSTFGPDPIEYRAGHGFLDFHEEMGVMIQEVVGVRVGKYFLPAFAGVAFSNNEFRWSPRIKRDDGLIRLVPGLGTRAVDRLSDDYPVLVAPGQPALRVNVTPDEVLRYSPNKMDVINLETNSFDTVEVTEFLRDCGSQLPGVEKLVSLYKHGEVRQPSALGVDFKEDSAVITFEGLISRTPFVKQVHTILTSLQKKLDTPVDIEFAHDGKDFYLLQCRPQSYFSDSVPVPIPHGIPEHDIVFTANRYVSNGRVPDITHIVYVDPQKYGELRELSELHAVGRAVGALNKLLPKRQFILMGPGRWGSRGDIKLGVHVSYADISNTAVLIEIARKTGNYMPDLSFGTHFFQDLVESSIRYLPLYPDDNGVVFNEEFLLSSENLLAKLLPEFADLSEVIRVIDVPQNAHGLVLRVLMNAEVEEAVGMLAPAKGEMEQKKEEKTQAPESHVEEHWKWRMQMAERIAASLQKEWPEVKGIYVLGSAKNATARAHSDIDLLVHFDGSEQERQVLEKWMDGWSLALGESNYLRTGYRSERLLDVYYVTSEQIAKRDGMAAKIGAITDAARKLTPRNGGSGD
jgi:pyruvate,water dikinase